MRIWYVVGSVEYWLEPDYQLSKRGTFRVLGCRLYTAELKFKGYWHWANIPLETKRRIRAELGQYLKNQAKVEKRERHWVEGHYRSYPDRDKK